MLRVAVTYCLVLTTAAGPWLCCCASSRMADARHLVQSFFGIAGGEHRGCCGNGQPPGRGHPCDPGAPAPAAPGECPCKVFAPTYAVLPPKPVEPAELPGEHLADPGLCGACPTPYWLPPAGSASGLRGGETSRQPANPRDILAVLQTLRC